MAGFGWQEMLIILVVVMVIFGAGKVPEVMRSLGAGVREIKGATNDLEEMDREWRKDKI